MHSFKVVTLASAVALLACGEPECPVGTYKIRNICRKLDAGPELTSDEAGALVGDGVERVDAEVDAPTSVGNHDAGQQAPDDAARPGSDSSPAPAEGGPRMENSGRTCDAGFESRDADVCADIDECARGLDDCDHDPQACLNTSGGFSCACPSGFRGAGKGTNGCVDIDECAEGTDSCDARATCNNTPGSYSCGACPAGFSSGDAGACQDLDECASNNGGCDTSPMATCNNRVGMTNTCACPAGYAGNGVGANGCADPCASNPCGTGFSCTRSAQATAVCGATCAAAGGLGCRPGDKCATDADCRTGGDSTATCDAVDKVCTRVCPATTISDPTHLTSERYCREINGTFTLNPSFEEIALTAFPYLTRVRGDLVIGSVANNVTRSITLSALRTIDGAFTAANSLMLTTLALPRVTSIGSNLSMSNLTALQRLSVPQLSSVTGNFALIGLTRLAQLDVNSLSASGGSMTFFLLCRLPSTQVSKFMMPPASATFANVGCCTSSTTSISCSAGACTCN